MEAQRQGLAKRLGHGVPGAGVLTDNWHIDLYCAEAQKVVEMLESGRPRDYDMVINVPPGTMKSLITNVFWPAWEWGPRNMPHMRYVCAAHSQDLAIRDGLRLEAIAADVAGDGDTALELLSVNAYDIAVLDRDIPGPSGDEIAKRI